MDRAHGLELYKNVYFNAIWNKFYSYLSNLFLFPWSSTNWSPLVSWMLHVFIFYPLTCILFHNYGNNVWLYILFENRVVAAESASGYGNWSQLRKQMSAAETDTAITWMNGNEKMTNDQMEMVMKNIFIDGMEWNG